MMGRKPGDECERLLDGLGFKCKVVAVNVDGSLKLEFEDGFVEDEVPPEEVQDASGGAAAPAEAQEVGVAQVVTEPVGEPKIEKKDTTYVVHGAENNVAAGSGLKGVRWLKAQT